MIKSNITVDLSEELIKVEEAKKSSQTNVSSPHRISLGNPYSFHDTVELAEDNFGGYYDENGNFHNIQRFTWRNRNKIQVQVINYGARITSIKMPDRKGNVDDIVLGFDDIAGYIYNKSRYFGATIGRMTSTVKNSTFTINNKQYWLTPNQSPHHYNGGKIGLDQAVWTTFVDDKKVIMSHVSPHLSEGYPGDLLIRIIFELSAKNEFNIKMEAQCTQPTIINLSNLTYFNLGGHHSGSTEIYKHILTLNCNCFTPIVDGLPTGEIMNVIHTEFDFQIPKVLGKSMGIIPKDGYNQNLCVNRAMNQDDCFLARILHPPSGRLLEIYSNQWGIHLSTANEFGYDNIMSTEQLVSNKQKRSVVTLRKCEGPEPLLRLYEKIHQEVKSILAKDEENTFEDIYNLIKHIKEFSASAAPDNTPTEVVDEEEASEEFNKKHEFLFTYDFRFTQMQADYLSSILNVLCDSCDEEECEELQEIVKLIIGMVKIKVMDEVEEENNIEVNDESEATKEKLLEKLTTPKKISSDEVAKPKKKPTKQNSIPVYYRSTNKIIGKNRAHYSMHGGIALQSQNYPACANFKNFPNCILKPGETYTHTITYKFWIRSGNPNKWIKRNMVESRNRKLI